MAARKPIASETAGATPHDCFRLTDAADGMAIWGHVTSRPFTDVVAPGYFDALQLSMERHDRIEVTANADTDEPAHATLVVTASVRGKGVAVEVLRGGGMTRKRTG